MNSKRYLRITTIVLSVLLLAKLNAQSPDWLWVNSIGGAGNCRAYSIAIDAEGASNLYLTGIYSGVVDFDPGPEVFNLTSAGFADIFVSKFDSSGHFEWARSFGGSGYDIGSSIAFDPSGDGAVYSTGNFQGTVDFDPGAGVFNLISSGEDDLFVIKLDVDGHFVWAQGIGGVGKDQSQAIVVDPSGSGNVFTTGSFSEIVDFDPGVETYQLTSAGDKDIFISKIDSSGNLIWVKAMGGNSIEVGYSLAIDPSGGGDMYVSGKFTGTVDFDPGADSFKLTAPFRPNVFISRLDESGNFKWAKSLTGLSGDFSKTATVFDHTGGGHVYTAGSFMGMVDFDPGADTFNLTADGFADMFISALDNSGHFEWTKAIGGPGADACFSLAIAPTGTGELFATGLFAGTTDFNPGPGTFNLTAEGIDCFISGFAGAGRFLWAKSVTGAGEDVGFSMAMDPSGHLHVTGYFDSPFTSFDADTLLNTDSTGMSSNGFIAKLDAGIALKVKEYHEQSPLSMFPNPVTNELTIELHTFDNIQVDVTVFSISGEVVFSCMDQYVGNEFTIDLARLPAGLYFVEVIADHTGTVRSVVKK